MNMFVSKNQTHSCVTLTKIPPFPAYADTNIFLRNREEQKTLLRHIVSLTDDYAKQYKLLKVGLLKILEILDTNRSVLQAAGYQPADGFPHTEATVDAFAAIVENTCLFGDLVLHTPEMSAKILAKQNGWRAMLTWSMSFARHFEATVFDDNSREMLSLFDQEINAERRRADYVNPYHSANRASAAKATAAKKERRKLRKGPQMTGAGGSRVDL